jgi:copper transport protein
VPLRRLAQGWYLVYWRVISADGHPVRGAFTFAVGPNPGPAPQFVIPSISETSATPQLLIVRWIVFLSAMAAIGLLALRLFVARPVVERVAGTSLRSVSIAFWVALGVALVASPVYVALATAKFALRSVFDLGAIVPVMRVSSFGRGFLDLEVVLALLGVAAAAALWLDRPERRQRSLAALLALLGAFGAAGAALLVPGLAGHAAQKSPRGLSLALDWVHLAAGSLWVGGLIGLFVLWKSFGSERRLAGLVVCVPRFSNVAFVSVLALIGSGIWAALNYLPTLGSLWDTSYGKSLILKIGLLAVALLLAAVNLLRTRPRLQASAVDPVVGGRAAAMLRRLVGGEALLIAGAVFGAVLLTSLPPPPKALAGLGRANAHVGPGPVARVVKQAGYELRVRVSPNKVAVPNTFAVRITRGGKPVRGADVTASFTMLDMEMPQLAYHLADMGGGRYEHSAPALVMVGRWGLSFEVQPPGGQPFDVLLVDKARG